MSLARPACAVLPEWCALTWWRWLPLQHLITQRLNTGSRAGQVKAPLRVVRASEDTMVKPDLGRTLYARANAMQGYVLIESVKQHEIVAAQHSPSWHAVAALLGVKRVAR